MISTEDPRIPPSLRRLLNRVLRPGETIRRPKRPPLPAREQLRAEYLALIVEYGSGRKACRCLSHRYGYTPECIRRRVRKTPTS